MGIDPMVSRCKIGSLTQTLNMLLLTICFTCRLLGRQLLQGESCGGVVPHAGGSGHGHTGGGEVHLLLQRRSVRLEKV